MGTKGKKKKKPFKHKWPKGWRPGVGKTGTDHPSVVRDRNPAIRNTLELALQLGHTHAVFKANPTCCPLCQKHDGRRQRIPTILRWAYPLPHPNCLCSWIPERVVKKSEQIKSSKLVDTLRLRHRQYVFSKATVGYSNSGGTGKIKGKPGLQLVQTTRGKRWKKVGEAVAGKVKSEVKETKEALKENIGSLSKASKEALNKVVGAIRKIAPGKKDKVNGVEVERHPSDDSAFKVHGVVVKGFKAASLAVKAIEQLEATAGQTASGSLRAGAEMAHGGQATRDVQRVGAKVTEKVHQTEAKVAQRKAKLEYERKAQTKKAKRKAKKGKSNAA